MTLDEYEQQAAPVLCQEVAAGKLPREVGKYRSMEQTMMFLQNPAMWFATFGEFNDPFEGKFRLADDARVPKKLMQRLRDGITEHMDSYGVLCLTYNLNNILMWAHYADKHRGAILVFDMTEDPVFFSAPFVVTYTFNYPAYTVAEHKQTLRCMATKFMRWQHENELRVLKPHCHGLRTVNKEALRKIIFGCKASDAAIAHVIEEMNAQGGYGHVVLQKAVMSKHAYELEYVDIKR